MIYKVKNENRFVLLEIIIALGMIAVAGILILRMFSGVALANARADDINTAHSMATNAIEELREQGVPIEATINYDADWRRLPLGETAENAEFRLGIYVIPNEGVFEIAVEGLYDVSVYVWDLRRMDEPIAYLYTRLYFPQ